MMLRHWARDRWGEVVFYQPAYRPPRASQMITYSFPLHGCIARLVLPVDLTMDEAAQMGRMVRTLTVDWEPEEATA